MSQSPKRVVALYDKVASDYADNFALEHDKKPMDQEILARFVDLVGESRPLWDLGCGPGETTRYLQRFGLNVSGLDLSPNNVKEAIKRSPELHFEQGDMLALDLTSSSVAAIVSFYAIVHFSLEQVETAFSEMLRVLKPGGHLLFTYHIGNETLHIKEFLDQEVDILFMLFEVDEIEALLQKVGFSKIETIEREPYGEDVEYQSRRAYVFAQKTLS